MPTVVYLPLHRRRSAGSAEFGERGHLYEYGAPYSTLVRGAGERSIETGRWVELTSRHGKVRVRALVTDRVQGRQLYMPMNSSEHAVNRLTGSHTDHATHTPAYKETAVKMLVLDETGPSPLPRINHRFGNPTPQRGVEVERKWKRPDYRMPGTNGEQRARPEQRKV